MTPEPPPAIGTLQGFVRDLCLEAVVFPATEISTAENLNLISTLGESFYVGNSVYEV